MICYDRHFPEAARMLAPHGTEAVFVPTAAKSELAHTAWEIELRGHAIANGYFVGAVNRVETEFESTYFGSSPFIVPIGKIVAQASGTEEEVLFADLEPDRLEEARSVWPFYRDRRPDAYGQIGEP